MHQHETRDELAGEEMATHGPPEEPDGAVANPQVLARMPDLDAAKPGPETAAKPARSDGRMLSQGLSVKLLAGGGLLLILAAVVPYLLNKGDPGRDRHPAPNADLAPAFTGGPDQTPNVQLAPPNISFNSQIPAAPAFVNGPQGPGKNAKKTPPRPGKQANPRPRGPGKTPPARPRARAGGGQAPAAGRVQNPNRKTPSQPPAARSQGPPPNWSAQPSWPPPQAPSNLAPPPAVRGPAMPNAQIPPPRYGGRYEPNRASPGYYQDPRQPQANVAQPQVHPNRSMTIDNRALPPGGGYQGNYRPEYRPSSWDYYRRDYRAELPAGRQPQYQADSRADPRYRYPAQSVQPSYRGDTVHAPPMGGPSDPGVARFEGIIAKPPVRTTYDRARPSVY